MTALQVFFLQSVAQIVVCFCRVYDTFVAIEISNSSFEFSAHHVAWLPQQFMAWLLFMIRFYPLSVMLRCDGCWKIILLDLLDYCLHVNHLKLKFWVFLWFLVEFCFWSSVLLSDSDLWLLIFNFVFTFVLLTSHRQFWFRFSYLSIVYWISISYFWALFWKKFWTWILNFFTVQLVLSNFSLFFTNCFDLVHNIIVFFDELSTVTPLTSFLFNQPGEILLIFL